MRTARIALPGIALIGTTFGLARYGYGLLVPDMRTSFGLDETTVGLLGSSAYLAYVGATIASVLVIARLGPRGSAVSAALLAAAGMTIIASASNLAELSIGVVIAGASSGLAFPPFADLAARHLDSARRGAALSAISSGTGWGVALGAPIALVLGGDWRAAWLVFAAASVLAAVIARALLPESRADARHASARLSASWFVCPRSRPLLLSAFLVGLAASVYWTFGPELVGSAQGADAAGVLFVVVGISSIGGSFANRVIERLGPASGFRVCGALLGASLAALTIGAGNPALAIASGLGFGITFNFVVAIQVIWSGEVFASRPSVGLAATMLMFALGQIVGPTLAGILIDHVGSVTAFAVAAAVMSLTLTMPPPRTLNNAKQLQTTNL